MLSRTISSSIAVLALSTSAYAGLLPSLPLPSLPLTSVIGDPLPTSIIGDPLPVTSIIGDPLPITSIIGSVPDPLPTVLPIQPDQCTTGPIQCCQTVQSAGSLLSLPSIASILPPVDPTVLVGVTCTPLTIVGLGGDSCSEQPVCCTDNSFGGVISVGCTPVNLN
ncbi:hydrophobin-domain-containing protein [Pluteus cervinus]|uniref:Hydrophobin-domain-containing protein n=1 Tax=Pluteus cervinus TaxID=181527 RepID=A0ACD3A4U8_9AGAR|nr:hydrophobin-domain-containing protein [Pluteus cervinus]